MRAIIIICLLTSLFSCRFRSEGFNSIELKRGGQEEKHGYWVEQDSDTTLLFVEYKYGVRHGKFVKIDKEGNLMVEGRMKKGVKHGLWIYYYPGRGKAAMVTYKQGTEVSKVINGTPKF